MDTRYLLDANIVIYIRQKRPEGVLRRFARLRAGEAAISVIAYGELLYGAMKSSQRESALERLRELSEAIPALPLPETAAETYGFIRAELESKGEMIGNNDLWIAAHAMAAGLTLVTNNEKEFRRVRGLKVQNWAAQPAGGLGYCFNFSRAMLHNVAIEGRAVTEYQNLTQGELLHLAEDKEQLTDEARLALDGELKVRRLSSSDIDSYRLQREAVEKADKLKRAAPSYIHSVGLGKKFFGKTNRHRDTESLFEQYDTTLWFVVLWFPVFPIATYTVRRDLERWLGMLVASDPVAIERHPRNWEQILLTWVKAAAVLLALRLTFLLLLRHPEWLRHLP
jgi:tRNA(fMet)-specific endonuclease VapC